jgi:hypothetical protein
MTHTDNIDKFFVMHAARADQWREALTAAEQWAAGTGSRAKLETGTVRHRAGRGIPRLSGPPLDGQAAGTNRRG